MYLTVQPFSFYVVLVRTLYSVPSLSTCVIYGFFVLVCRQHITVRVVTTFLRGRPTVVVTT